MEVFKSPLKFESMNVLKLFISFIFLTTFLTGCVGVVNNAGTDESVKLELPPTYFDYSGITSARAVAHDKIEIEFYPVGGEDIVYKLIVNESNNPIVIDPKTVSQSLGGKLLYTIKDLKTDTEFKLKLKAYKTKLNEVSKNENQVFVRTFDNQVADFLGVSRLTLVPGSRSNSIQVDWIPSKMTGTFTAGDYDPYRYQVSIVSEHGGAANINNSQYFGTDKRVIYVPDLNAPGASPSNNPKTVNISGLAADTRYFVQVRAIHKLYDYYSNLPDVFNIPVSKDMNTKFLSIKTDPADTLFDFRQDNVILKNAQGRDAFSNFDIFWQPGSGAFYEYRVFYRKYDGTSNPTADDRLTENVIKQLNDASSFKKISTSLTSTRISGLETNTWYQVKVALCKTITCPVESTNPDAAIISDLRAIRVQATLAPFTGINSVEPPGQFSEKDIVNLKFDAPLITAGHADALEFYCVDPLNKTNVVKMSNTPISGSSIARCNGVYLPAGPVPPLTEYTSQKVRGLVTNGSTEYCFAASPAILEPGSESRLDPSNMIVRCSFPEVLPPTVAQFPGLKQACAVSGASAQVAWDLPLGGIYSGFKVFWKEKDSTKKFSFPDATQGATGYSNSPELTASTLNHTITNLMPGITYQIGVLATVQMDVPTPNLFSEYNLNIVECQIPLPVASFKGFSRIFAIGPKMDGRIPNDPSTSSPPTSGANSALLYEALNADGIPYEVEMNGPNSAKTDSSITPYTAPPGRDYGTGFGQGFDGVPEAGGSSAFSKNGIISLAWEEVEMNYSDAEEIFSSPINQPNTFAPRENRKWGYRVYRSHDNKMTWTELTNTSGLIYSMNYTYKKRTDLPNTTSRMAFFTDYSVKALEEVHDSTKKIDVERARTYYYKIVPVFNGHNLNYSNKHDHIVRVTLPPPNMALVHRWMANRQRCMELEKNYSIRENYSCDYNGIGASPRTIPNMVGQTALDQGGDLLIDRFELGCRYTRGERTSEPELGASNFKLQASDRRKPTDNNFYPLFKGYSTNNFVTTDTVFKGCTGANLQNANTNIDLPENFQPSFQKVLHGDCIGAHLDKIALNYCSPAAYTLGNFVLVNVNVPGADVNLAADKNCSEIMPMDPKNFVDRYFGDWAPNIVMQSEFMAVYYNNFASSLGAAEYFPDIFGPKRNDITAAETISHTNINSGSSSASCSINLASIGADNNMSPRWFSTTELGLKRVLFKGARNSLLSKTVDEITEVETDPSKDQTLYNGFSGDGYPNTGANFRLPEKKLRSSPRYRGTTRLARIMASNSAKLPPLGRLPNRVANELCSNFHVQTGIATDSGNFSPDAPPKAKRSLRRIESVTASSWPERYDQNQIQTLEKSNAIGSCVNTTKNISGQDVQRGGTLLNRMSIGNWSISHIPLLTGSSPLHGTSGVEDLFNSSKCISRYGVQDAVGNLGENNSEVIFCDYSQDQANLGLTTGQWNYGNSAINVGSDQGVHVPYFYGSEDNSSVVLMSGKLKSELTPRSFSIKFRDGSAVISDYKPWVKISAESGYCSVVDSNPSRRDPDEGNPFRDPNGIWSSILSPGGSLNTNLILNTQADQLAIKTLRNGDGRFLDFGPNGFAPALNLKNTLSLSLASPLTNEKSGKYFNPIIGLPLSCAEYSCEDSSLAQSSVNDNMSISITSFKNRIDGSIFPNPSTTSDFPIGNSDITNSGISEFDFSQQQSVKVPMGDEGSKLDIGRVLTAITVDDATFNNPVRELGAWPDDFTPGSDLFYYRIRWDIERGTNFSFLSGGSSNTVSTGRYTANVISSINATNATYGTSDLTRGARCAVVINED